MQSCTFSISHGILHYVLLQVPFRFLLSLTYTLLLLFKGHWSAVLDAFRAINPLSRYRFHSNVVCSFALNPYLTLIFAPFSLVSRVNNSSLLLIRAISFFILYLKLQTGTYRSPTVARPLLYILEIMQNTIPHIFHANKFSLTVLPSCISRNFDHSCRLYTILCLKFLYSVCINHRGLYLSNR